MIQIEDCQSIAKLIALRMKVMFIVITGVLAGTASATLRVDFGTLSSPVESGYEAYTASHEQPVTFTAQQFSAFDSIVTVTPTWALGATAEAMQMIVRKSGYSGAYSSLLDDWIGTDTRQPGNPLTLTLRGLPAGSYSWLSYHHDLLDQTGQFDVTIFDANGQQTISNVDITNGTTVSYETITKLSAILTSNGTDDVRLVFSVISSNQVVSLAFFVMNGFELESNDPCYNLPPQVDGPDAILALVGRPIVMEVTVSDDGKPYIEGCNPADPQPGTAYPLAFQWLQQSGSGTAGFDPPSADQQAVRVTFPRPGRYELSLDVSDAPAGAAGGKTTRHTLTVEVVEPMGGDVDFNKVVNFDDLLLAASQWLSSCMGELFCADLDNSGLVTLADFSEIAENWLVTKAQVVINEFVASNRLGKLDGDGHNSDWIELTNHSSEAVSLDGWFLTDDPENPQKWAFPANTVLPSEGYLIVFASGQSIHNYVDPAGYLHTNFALDKDGEYLALVYPNGRAAHEYRPAYPPQETDISFGLWYDLYRYFASPTPGKANSDAFLGFTDKPNYSRDRGFYDEPFTLEISSDTPGAFIHYTLDGSEPTEQDGLLYDPNAPLQIGTTAVVRSIAIKPGYRPGPAKTATFIFPDDVAQQPADPDGWPSNWSYDQDVDSNDGSGNGIIPSDYEMDPRVVNSTLPGYSIRDALLDIPTVSIAMLPEDFLTDGETNGIYANPLQRWERKCSIEYILPDGQKGFQEDCKIEVHGNASRRPFRMQKHSLRLTFTSEYGVSKLNYPLFENCDVEEFNQLVLRACFTDSWGLVSWDSGRYRPNDSQYTRDVWMKRSLADMGQPSSAGDYVHVYVNGLYFGVFNLTERLSEDFFADHLGGQPENWEINADFSTPRSRWNEMMSCNPASLAGYEQMKDYLDMENFADYMLLHFYADAEDWPHHNGYAAANPVSGDGKFRFFVWDQEIVLDYHGRAASRIDSTGGVGALFQKMRTSEEFRLLFADRVYKHCFNNGAISISGSQNRYFEIANIIDKAIVAESARWGDTRMKTPYGSTIGQPNPLDDINHNLYPPAPNGPDFYFTREQSWLVERDNVINNYIPAIHDMNNSYAIVKLFRSKALYPAADPPVLNINGTAQHGGHAETDDLLTMTNPGGSGTIYYTLDGSDPRLPGGEVNTASAAAYSGAIPLLRSTLVKARIKSDTTWSALAEATYAVGPVAESLRISELMYHPAEPKTEFIELLNVGEEPINLNMVSFTKGVDYVFGDVTLQPGHYTVIVEDQTAFINRYGSGLSIAGQYTGRLDNGGERIKFKDAVGLEIQDFSYDDDWHELTDGFGFSLTMVNPASTDPKDWGRKSGWRSSLAEGGTPGSAPLTVLPAGSIVINELLAHSHNDDSDWIELRNTTSQAINIGGWFLSDDNRDPNVIRKYEIPPETIIAAGGYQVFVQATSFGNLSQPPEKRFGLSEGGETVYLYSGSNGQVTGFYQTEENFDASETDVTFGRYEKAELSGGYDFARMLEKTQGYANSGPRIPDIVITEIYYNPPQGSDYEFIELYNRSGDSVTLMSQATTETSPGVFVTEYLPWRLKGVDYEFPAHTVIAPGAYVILAKDPALYNSLSCDVYGPYDGKLDNAGEQVEILMPGDLEYGKTRYWIPIEKIDYDDTAPWPTSADGAGDSLHRITLDAYGRDYSNWNAGVPTPGA
jgi:hypothetical protein